MIHFTPPTPVNEQVLLIWVVVRSSLSAALAGVPAALSLPCIASFPQKKNAARRAGQQLAKIML
jgi:hypothetical protein